MTNKGFPITIDFERLLRTLASEIYDTPMAFLRENVQNAVDAIRIHEAQNAGFSDGSVTIEIDEKQVTITDNGVGMSESDQRELFWRIGASGKNTPEAKRAGCIGTFGIGGFANFGVCERLVVTSKREGYGGFRTALQRSDFGASDAPGVSCEPCDDAAPHGTIVEAELHDIIDTGQLRDYIRGFVKYIPEQITFNKEVLSGEKFINEERISSLSILTAEPEILSLSPHATMRAKFYKDDAGAIVVVIDELSINGVKNYCQGYVRLINGTIDVFKRGFKLCSTNVPNTIGISGRLDTVNVAPTAGRDSLSAESQQFLSTLGRALEKRAIEMILNSKELLSQHVRILRQVIADGMIERLGELDISLADGDKTTLGELRKRHESGTKIYFGTRVERELLDVLQASGNLIVILSSDSGRRKAEKRYLVSYCEAMNYEGLVEVKEKYANLLTFEIDFLANLEMTIKTRYEVTDFILVPAAITGGVPAYIRGRKGGTLTIYVDVRHKEISQLKPLEGSSFLYSMATEFCKEYLAGTLKARSQKFFGNGSLDFDELIKKRAELWKLSEGDIATSFREVEEMSGERTDGPPIRNTTGIRDVFKASDIEIVEVGHEDHIEGEAEGESEPRDIVSGPKILKLVDKSGTLNISGFYFKLMDGPAKAFRDDIQAMEEVSVFWFGNRITYAFTDAQAIVFHYELRLQQIVLAKSNTEDEEPKGIIDLANPLQEYQGFVYFRIPEVLNPYIVPTGGVEILVRVNYDWFDLRRGRAWPY